MPLDFGDNAVTLAATPPPADKTPASSPPAVSSPPLLAWLALALALGFLVMKG